VAQSSDGKRPRQPAPTALHAAVTAPRIERRRQILPHPSAFGRHPPRKSGEGEPGALALTSPDLPVEAGGPAKPPASAVERLTGAIAVAGGLTALAVAALVTTSVLGRWLFAAPIDGDFEFVKMATAIAIFAYLPYTQARRGNIMVDTFTGRLSPRARVLLDAFWDLAYAALMAFVAYCLVYGTLDAIRSGETTMQRQLLVWPSIAVATALCALLAVTAVVTALRLLNARSRRSAR
jgi:TRAP-type C4-dicarboxylate transport system permease small subunit